MSRRDSGENRQCHQETSPKEEARARARALPLRKRVGWSADGTEYRLSCGHITEPDPFGRAGDLLPCLLCYLDGLKKARVMVEGD